MDLAKNILKCFLRYKSPSTAFVKDIISIGEAAFNIKSDNAVFILLMDITRHLYDPLPKGVELPVKDVESRAVKLELLLTLLRSSNERLREDDLWTYIIRRMVCPCLFGSFYVKSPRIFKAILDIISALLKYFKVLFDSNHFFFLQILLSHFKHFTLFKGSS